MLLLHSYFQTPCYFVLLWVFLSQCLANPHVQRTIIVVMATTWPDDCCQGNVLTCYILQTQYHHRIIKCHTLTALPHFKWLYVTQYYLYRIIKQSSSFLTFLFSFMYYYKGLGEGFLVVHHGQDHIHIERGASFIRGNALECKEQSVRSEPPICQDSCASGTAAS